MAWPREQALSEFTSRSTYLLFVGATTKTAGTVKTATKKAKEKLTAAMEAITTENRIRAAHFNMVWYRNVPSAPFTVDLKKMKQQRTIKTSCLMYLLKKLYRMKANWH